MDLLSKKLDSLKEKFSKQQKEQARTQEEVKRVFNDFFPNTQDLIREFYTRGGKLIVKTKNKTFASELFLKKESLEQGILQSLGKKYQLVIY